jgi:hypothetical protein
MYTEALVVQSWRLFLVGCSCELVVDRYLAGSRRIVEL